MTKRQCARCAHFLQQPIEANANYVRANDFKETETREVHYAMKHTGKTRAKVDRVLKDLPERNFDGLAAEMAHPEAPETREVPDGVEVQGNTETAVTKEVEFSIPEDEFEHVPVDTPQAINNEDVALVYAVEEDIEVEKTGLVCSDCTKETDTIIWGPDN